MTDYFVRIGEAPKLSDLIAISERKNGNVHFANAGGGLVYFTTEAEFDKQFERVPNVVLRRLFETFEPITVTALEGDGSMDGYTNGQSWNGWEVPYFTRKTILDALEEGGHLANPAIHSNTRFHFDDASNDLYVIEPADGGDIPDGYDEKVLKAYLMERPSTSEVYAFGQSVGLQIFKADKIVAIPKGETEPEIAYELGNGWCWGDMAAYGHQNDLSAAPRP